MSSSALHSMEFQPLNTSEDDISVTTSEHPSPSRTLSAPRRLKIAYYVGNCLIVNVPFINFQMVIGPHWPGVFVAMLTNLGGTMLFNQLLRMAHKSWVTAMLQYNTTVMFMLVNIFLVLTAIVDPGIIYPNDYAAQQLEPSDISRSDDSLANAAESGMTSSASVSSLNSSGGKGKKGKKGKRSSPTKYDKTRAPSVPHTYCDMCEVYQITSKRVLHCQECNVCIAGLDHHCPWMGKCIGKKNMFVFMIFNGCWIVYILELLFCVMFIS